MKLHMHFAPLLLLAACASHEPPHTTSDVKDTQVTMPVQSTTIDCVGVVTSADVQAIAVQTSSARVTKLLVNDGDPVHKGDLIAHLDTTQLGIQLAQAEGERDAARGEEGRAYVQAAEAEREARQEQRMANVGVSSLSEEMKARSQAAADGASGAGAAGRRRTAEAKIKEIQEEIAQADLKAPMDGIVAGIKFHEGEDPQKGMTFARVFNPQKLVVKFALPRLKHDAVRLGDHVELAYENDRRISATVSQIIDGHDVAIDFLTVVAILDKTAPRSDDLQVGVRGVVHLADKANEGVLR